MARLSTRFGHTEVAAGKRVIVEHTSSNPNAPLHIGNLRNVMIGAHLARLLAAVGYKVQQAFYVNDLGAQVRAATLLRTHLAACASPFAHAACAPPDATNAAPQIGLTALAYERCYPLLRPSMKIDQWIGCMYAVMNTCQELQRVGVDPGALEEACVAGTAAVETLQKKCVSCAFS